jgi:hypothetical protein
VLAPEALGSSKSCPFDFGPFKQADMESFSPACSVQQSEKSGVLCPTDEFDELIRAKFSTVVQSDQGEIAAASAERDSLFIELSTESTWRWRWSF